MNEAWKEFQPLNINLGEYTNQPGFILGKYIQATIAFGTLFGMAFVIGWGLRIGWGS